MGSVSGGRANHRAFLRRTLTNRQGGRCFYCKHKMGPPGSGQLREATLDEVIPRCAGGPQTWRNTVAACKVCNEAKGDMPAADFIAVLREFQEDAANV